MAWLSGYSTRRKLTIDCTKIDSALSDFPVLVKLTSTQLDFAKANSDGFDIRFTSSNGTTLLKYERERHDNGNSLAEYWVKVASVASGSDTDIYMYYRTTDTADGADPTNVWDANFLKVWHMKDDPDTSTVQDSTSGNHDGSKVAANLPLEVNGLAAKGQDFEASSNASIHVGLDVFSSAELASGTIEQFVKTEDAGEGDRQTMNYEDRLVMRMISTTFNALLNDGSWHSVTGSTTPSTSNWYHVAQTWDGSTLTLYVDGVSEGTPAAAGSPSMDAASRNLYVGSSFTPNRPWDGLMDEFRLSGSCRTASWMKASTNSGKNTLLTYGSEEVPSVDTGNFFQLF